MTIASEISRLQWAKADIKTAIENKWVTVWNITLDGYASCIDSISTGEVVYKVNVLAVWWGGWWANWSDYWMWWWGGGWWVMCYNDISLQPQSCVIIWLWGGQTTSWWSTCICDGCWVKLVAIWWIWWHLGSSNRWNISSWAWWSSWNWKRWWDTSFNGSSYSWSWWWGWASANWCNGWCWTGGAWGAWLYWFWWWWGWWWYRSAWGWGAWWGWSWGCRKPWCNATACWWWWWGGGCYCWWWCWCGWVMDICYKIDWSWWFTSATWWNCCFTCDWYCVHRFTSNGTFTIVG